MVSESPRPLGIDVSHSTMESPPAIAALFVISFDIRTGYFVHEQYAGISAFLNHPATEAERNANMFAIGVLVPLSTGRLGKSWRHAPRLKELTLKYAGNMSDMQPLCDYWDTYRIGGTDLAPDSPLDSPLSLRFRPGERPDHSSRNRAFSDAMVLETFKPALTPFHPASSLPGFTECFGPLIFPLYRAALLRKRILFMGEAPVHTPCNFVYDLSLLASLPNSLLQLLPADRIPPLRPRPLFNVGIHDIPYLSSFDPSRSIIDPETDPSWIACSTDTVLTMKPDLFDVLVTLPAPYSQQTPQRAFPKISLVHKTGGKPSQTQEIHLKATQRDARRYSMLRRGLHQLSNDRPTSPEQDPSDTDSTYSSSPVVEPISWTRLAYTSFIWWASAGENRDGLSEEEEEQQIEQDSRLLASVENLARPPYNSTSHSDSPRNPLHEDQQPPEVALVAYFRRLTSQIFVTLAGAIARYDSDLDDDAYNDAPYIDEDDDTDASLSMSRQSIHGDEGSSPLLRQRSSVGGSANHGSRAGQRDGGTDDTVTITVADMAEMGLDVWSATDRVFVEELVSLWWGRAAKVDSARIRCCGISVL
ncbi:unnamed protein product [Penicillium nalgiovense]|uniref:DUF4484 domain-containing protein n=1 Tax=Penicillium nalgiovense TaxID=60175 RepID=A0A9W4MNY9_PENNA|nr:unnamed protein product [Penicillium nalgiovense]CAG7994487.1 unnamed protein product [Penicillium nalgiovense]CAG8003034.1 unnamed protein product [Penicillium nalgiovense]CAG8012635.1 unnamed protein product [Penicillium nalgiovense]CAG8021917.1 unnamed protein product [Penicillium nalgiovense]